jgi:hypothetical protein
MLYLSKLLLLCMNQISVIVKAVLIKMLFLIFYWSENLVNRPLFSWIFLLRLTDSGKISLYFDWEYLVRLIIRSLHSLHN